MNYLLFISNDPFFPSVHFRHSHPMCATSGWWFGQPSSTWTSLRVGGQNYCREFGKRSLMIMLQTSKNEYSKVYSKVVLNTHRKTYTDSLFLSLTRIYSPCLPPSVPETLGPLTEIYCGPSGFLKSLRHHHQQLPRMAQLDKLNEVLITSGVTWPCGKKLQSTRLKAWVGGNKKAARNKQSICCLMKYKPQLYTSWMIYTKWMDIWEHRT